MVNHRMYSDEEDSQEDQCINYKQKYRALKKNLRYLIYENECFQDELRKAQYNFVSISRDKSFLLDRILNYEKPQGPSSDSEATESSDEEDEASKKEFEVIFWEIEISEEIASSSNQFCPQRKRITKRKRSVAEAYNGNISVPTETIHGHQKAVSMKPSFTKPVSGKGNLLMKKAKKPPAARKGAVKKEKDVSKAIPEKNLMSSQVIKNYDISNVQIANEEQVDTSEHELHQNVTGVEFGFSSMSGSEGHLTREEVERHLESRRFSPELNTTATVPAELFSHEPDPESDFEDSEICEFIQLEEDATSADVVLE